MTETTPLERFVHESARIKSEMIKELLIERDALHQEIDDLRAQVAYLQAEAQKAYRNS